VGLFEDLEELDFGMAELKWLPGPVSSLGSGALRGSSMYLEAWGVIC
jgi:hypothetical protein